MQFDRAVQYGEPRVLRKVSKREVEPIDLGNNGTDLDTLAFVEIAQIKGRRQKTLGRVFEVSSSTSTCYSGVEPEHLGRRGLEIPAILQSHQS
jgi:hypothetical protein